MQLSKALRETEAFQATYPPLKHIIAETPEETEPARVLESVRRHLTSEALLPLLRYELAQYRDVPFYRSPSAASSSLATDGVTLLNTPTVLVNLLVIDADRFARHVEPVSGTLPLRFAAGDSMLTLLAGKAATVELFSADPVQDDTPLSHKMRCRKQKTLTLKPGENLTCRGGAEAMRYRSFDGPAVLLQAYCRLKRTSVIAEYDGSALTLNNVIASDQRINRLQIAASLARRLNRRDALPQLKELTRYPDHYVRWHAARELTAMAPADSLSALHRLAEEDPNAGVRANASTTLTYLEARHIHAS